MQYAFSDNVSSLQPSAIREILTFTSMPGVISFAAGNPASEAFPVDHIRQISADLLQKDPLLALQYNRGISQAAGTAEKADGGTAVLRPVGR